MQGQDEEGNPGGASPTSFSPADGGRAELRGSPAKTGHLLTSVAYQHWKVHGVGLASPRVSTTAPGHVFVTLVSALLSSVLSSFSVPSVSPKLTSSSWPVVPNKDTALSPSSSVVSETDSDWLTWVPRPLQSSARNCAWSTLIGGQSWKK